MKLPSSVIASLALFFLLAGLAGAVTNKTAAPLTWQEFWQSVKVSLPPPRHFLDGEYTGQILNLTDGKLSDATVRRWVLADLRRGRGDNWALNQLRLDVVNAGVFGPPGLNGTDESIRSEIKLGVVRRQDLGAYETTAAAVVAVPPDLMQRGAYAGLTNYVIVLKRQTTGRRNVRVFHDGHSEPIGDPLPPGLVRWWLDTGEFRDVPPLGPIWYQARGWTCARDGKTATDEVCEIVKRALSK